MPEQCAVLGAHKWPRVLAGKCAHRLDSSRWSFRNWLSGQQTGGPGRLAEQLPGSGKIDGVDDAVAIQILVRTR